MATLKTDNILGTTSADAVTVGDDSTATDLTVKGNIIQVAGTNTFVSNSISGDAVHGGTISDFKSTGIDDEDSTTNCLTINSADNVLISAASDLVVGGDATIAGDLTVANVEITGSLNVATSPGIYVFGHVTGTVAINSANNMSGVTLGDATGGCIDGGVATRNSPLDLTFTFNSETRPTAADYRVLINDPWRVIDGTTGVNAVWVKERTTSAVTLGVIGASVNSGAMVWEITVVE
jgi:hypothetical protein